MIHINRIWWEIANTIRLSHFISSGVTPYAEEQLTLVVMKNKVENGRCLSIQHRQSRLPGGPGTFMGPMLSFWAPLPVPPVTWAPFGFGLGEEFLLHSQAVLLDLWSLKCHMTWYCMGGPRSDRINILLFLLWWVLVKKGDTGRENVPRALPSTHQQISHRPLPLSGGLKSSICCFGLSEAPSIPVFHSSLPAHFPFSAFTQVIFWSKSLDHVTGGHL